VRSAIAACFGSPALCQELGEVLSPFPLLVLLFAAPVELATEDGERAKIIVLDLVNGTDLSDARIEALGDAVVSALSGAPVEVLSAADLRKTIEIKASQSALGCIQGDCLLDLAKAWQARYLLTGSLASFKGQMILNLKLIDSKNDQLKVLLRETHESKPEALTALVRISAAKMRQALGGPAPSDAERAVLRAGVTPLIGLSVGAVSAGMMAYALFGERRVALDFGARAELAAADPVLGPHLRDQSDVSLARSHLIMAASAVGFGAATWLWWKGW
jgi:TolB-like protein